MWKKKIFLLISVFIIAVTQTATVTADMTSIAKDGNQDVTTQTPWPDFIPCQYAENSTYFCPKERPNFGSCSSPPASNDNYCTEKGYCQCDYNYNFIFIMIATPFIIIGLVFIICCICCFYKKRRRDRNVEKTETSKVYYDHLTFSC